MSEWQKYSRAREATKLPSGVIVIRPVARPVNMPACCPVCGVLPKDDNDILALQDVECCRDCATQWAYPKIEEWRAGWRPSSVEIDAEVEKRKAVYVQYI